MQRLNGLEVLLLLLVLLAVGRPVGLEVRPVVRPVGSHMGSTRAENPYASLQIEGVHMHLLGTS
jgi:hypothetical protein